MKERCFGGSEGPCADCHDHEWGVPSHDDRHLFEMLILEGMQAGLSWELILKRRVAFRCAFHGFDPVKVAAMGDAELEALCRNPAVIRNQRKIFGARQNARAFLAIQGEFGSFDAYVWGFVEGKPIQNHWKQRAQVPCTSPEGDLLAKDLKARSMTFVGPKIIYSFMQAVGLVNDHLLDCICGNGASRT